MTGQHLDAELLTALLDGELDDSDRERVDAWLAEDAAARAEFAQLSSVRDAVRSLGPVEPPFGFFERLARNERRAPRRRRVGLAGAIAATVAMAVFMVGFAPSAGAVVPEVGSFAARHAAMASSLEGDDGGTQNGFVEMAPDQMSDMPAPYRVPSNMGDSYRPVMAFHGTHDVVHLVYAHDRTMVSVFEQPGSVQWSAMPTGGTSIAVPGGSAWMMEGPDTSVVVVERPDLIYTVVASGTGTDVMAMASSLPEAASPSVPNRLMRASEAFNRAFAGGL